jgi:dihydrolipoamide dehydrogenase
VEAITDTEVRFTSHGQSQAVARDLVLVATGRTCNVDNLGLETVGVDFDRRGIRIDDRCATNVPGIWAGGDVTGKVWLAHAGSRMGEVIVNTLTGVPDRMRYDTIAGVIYTTPEVATVGLTRAEADHRGIPVQTAKMPMSANGRFLAEHSGDRGLAKVVVHAETDVLLGVQLIGGACSEMIFGAAAMIEAEFRVREIRDVVFPHPTSSEIIRDTLFALP